MGVAFDTTPELLVWQVPNHLQYYYVALTTTPMRSEPADCTNATRLVGVLGSRRSHMVLGIALRT